MYEYPKKLVDHLTDCESEGAEILITHGEDSTVFLVKYKGLEKWFSIIEWYEGQDGFTLVNVNGKAFHRVHKMIHEFVD